MQASYCADGRDRLIVFEIRNRRGLLPLHHQSSIPISSNSPNFRLRVSELVLGTGMFGTNWGHGADRDESRRMFDGYVEADGNFLDTSDSYQFGKSDSMLGEFIDPKGSLSVTGNSRKAMVRSLETAPNSARHRSHRPLLGSCQTA
jgi:aryl-alcohol dehydrogenase-like predicted oxidoreductase